MPGARFADVRRFESIDSTNRYLLDEARSGAPEGVVAVAAHQTAGRGRLGRRWEAPPGDNLLLSVLLRPVLDAGDRHLCTAAVALAAADAATTVTAGSPRPAPIGIKWPNDLVDDGGRKLAGVLAESDLGPGSTGPGLPPPVVVGIGVNVNWPETDDDLPPELRGSAVSLRMLTGAPVDADALLTALLTALEPRVADLGSAEGRSRLAGDLRRRCTTVGTRVRVELADGSFEGTATDVTDAGHLLVETGGTTRTVVAGDVVHVRPGP